MPSSYEQLGSFYLGREVDPATGKDSAELLLYESRDLTTHAVCVGMTGSGKTGLCLALLEEAAIDGVPTIAIDPKGDIGNLLLSFPELKPADFRPWIDAGDASRKGLSADRLAQSTAESWKKGLADWDQDGDRIRRFREAADVAIYTPGSAAGRSLSVLRSFAAPPPALLNDTGAIRERIGSTVAGLLGLVGIDADPLKSREHILLSTLLDQAWREGRDLDLASLIQDVQKPPFDKVGVFDLDTFYPAKARLELAMSLNALIAAPGFGAWMEGEPLDIQSLLYTPAGKPRIAIISIAHLSDAERMFAVTLVLGELVAWMRRQSGTSSLRALLYMDEILGYFPPSAMPPSKQPLLTLMKQARAFGIGVVLATQNPVDLDYKGLSNAGTWFIGRLQTERDKARVIEGLLGADGEGLDREQLEALLANLQPRVFLMRNAHEAAPVLFKTRWALSYLRGPLTLDEIAKLSTATREPQVASIAATAPVAASRNAEPRKPVIPSGITEYYIRSAATTATRSYSPRVIAVARMHFVNAAAGIDTWEARTWIAPLAGTEQRPDWSAADVASEVASTASNRDPFASYLPVPAALLRAENYSQWRRQLEAHVYETCTLELFRNSLLGAVSAPGGSEADFRARIALGVREKRDAAVDALKRKHGPKLQTLQDQMRRARERIERERSQLSEQKMNTAISVGTSILGALFGRKGFGVSDVGRVGTAARSAGRIGRESEDVARAEESLEVLQQRYADLEQDLVRETAALQQQFSADTIAVERIVVKAKKSDIDVTEIGLAWVAV